MSEGDSTVIDAGAWVLHAPRDLSPDAPIVCVPTVHPRGDQRVIRVAQAALDAGFRVAFIWPGTGSPSEDARAAEVLLRPPQSTRERLRLVTTVDRRAREAEADVFHIHDLYLLPFAARWARRRGVPFVYDVHEHYGTYYASRLRLSGRLRDLTARLIDAVQRRWVRANGGVDAVADEIAAPYREAGIPVSVSPNYPLTRGSTNIPVPALSQRSTRAIHIGTLSAPYGMERLVKLAAALRGEPDGFGVDVVGRFPNAQSRIDFEEVVRRHGSPDNLRVIPVVPAHEIPSLLTQYRVGLSTIEAGGQNDIAIPTKLYEYVRAGLAVVGTDRGAQRRFLHEHGVGFVSDDDTALADATRDYLRDDVALDEKARRAADDAQEVLDWSRVSEGIGDLLKEVHGGAHEARPASRRLTGRRASATRGSTSS
ncbi:glycosyltransferase [Microbacterium sp. K36]|uniref:glycosyltransferase n=1 Tax=Microbacterium sp. K36 TaxID=2305439 RepID=UPI00109D4615|nr:glycosyltransferase [Microbacterium sp. K36]